MLKEWKKNCNKIQTSRIESNERWNKKNLNWNRNNWTRIIILKFHFLFKLSILSVLYSFLDVHAEVKLLIVSSAHFLRFIHSFDDWIKRMLFDKILRGLNLLMNYSVFDGLLKIFFIVPDCSEIAFILIVEKQSFQINEEIKM